MIRSIFVGLMCLFSAATFAECARALPIDHDTFCPSFKTAAVCYCKASGLPELMCQDMNMLYQRMKAVYSSLEKACANQKYTSQEDCIANWKCYGSGNATSPDGKNCKKMCEKVIF